MRSVIQMKDIVFVEGQCSKELGRIVISCHTPESYDAIMELLNDGKVIE
jgi:hypothetical protein